MPAMYGLPKIHKIGDKMRPIISNIKSPTSKIANYVVQKFKTFKYPKGLSIMNSMQLTERIKDIEIKDDELLVSFDVVGLYPSIPTNIAFQAIETFLNNNTNNDEKIILTDLVKLCMDQSYFQFRNKFYKQVKGVPMGCCASPFVADFFMDHFENSIKNEIWFPSFWVRYVDDVLSIVKKDKLDESLKKLNSIHPDIQFTMEVEKENSLPFLDLILSRENGNIDMSIYRKPTDNQMFINASSFHHQSHKHAAFHSMFHRLFNIPMSKTSFDKELKYIRDTGRINGYTDNEIEKIFMKHEKKSKLCTRIRNYSNSRIVRERIQESKNNSICLHL
jgi:hypothetical protein